MLSGLSKRQGCVSHSTPEAELVANTFALRNSGLPSVILWDIILAASRGQSPDDSVHIPLCTHADNQAMLQCVKTGRSPSMRYLQRTHRVSVAWIKEVCDQPHVRVEYTSSDAMAADIFTKGFTDIHRWHHACAPINVGQPDHILQYAVSCTFLFRVPFAVRRNLLISHQIPTGAGSRCQS